MLIGIDHGDPAGDRCFVTRIASFLEDTKLTLYRRRKPVYFLGDPPPARRSASMRKRRRIVISQMRGRPRVIKFRRQLHIESITQL